ncbi:hypothetical protein [Paraburkholderia sp. RAU2J]|uniref:hypothetical protein n=1 Tax=Paraburkholderia sp. RAU2J TaxID=1938810 RepID=UPI000EB2B184|nr:hypothetical protein [Paraburkholderia sp. RAU2J]
MQQLTDAQLLEHFEMPGLNLEATLDAHDLGLLLTGIRSLLSANKPAAPEGWRLVPVQPTPEMVRAAIDWASNASVVTFAEIYCAMLAASPDAPAAQPAVDAGRERADATVLVSALEGTPGLLVAMLHEPRCRAAPRQYFACAKDSSASRKDAGGLGNGV